MSDKIDILGAVARNKGRPKKNVISVTLSIPVRLREPLRLFGNSRFLTRKIEEEMALRGLSIGPGDTLVVTGSEWREKVGTEKDSEETQDTEDAAHHRPVMRD